jgi:hypothetical protein
VAVSPLVQTNREITDSHQARQQIMKSGNQATHLKCKRLIYQVPQVLIQQSNFNARCIIAHRRKLQMFAPGIVIFEKTRRWEAILKRHFLGTVIQVRPCRLPSEMLGILGTMPGGVAVIDLSAGTAQGLRLITQIGWKHPQSRTLVLAPASLADFEWPAREFGATAFLPDSISDAHLGQLCSRQLESRSQTDFPTTNGQERFHVTDP